MSRNFRIFAGDGAPVAVLWYARRVFENHGWVESAQGYEAVVAFGEACAEVAGAPGIYLNPPLTATSVSVGIEAGSGPMLVVGVSSSPTWSAAAAARLRRPEVLQLAMVDESFEVEGSVIASIEVLNRLVTRFEALLARLG